MTQQTENQAALTILHDFVLKQISDYQQAGDKAFSDGAVTALRHVGFEIERIQLLDLDEATIDQEAQEMED